MARLSLVLAESDGRSSDMCELEHDWQIVPEEPVPLFDDEGNQKAKAVRFVCPCGETKVVKYELDTV